MNGVTKCRTERTTELRKVRDGAMGTCILPSMQRPLRLGDTLVPKWKERAEKNENEDASHWPPVRKCPQHLELSEQCCSCLRGSSKSQPLEPGGAHRAPVLGLLGTATFPRAAQRRTSPLPCARTQKTTPG